MTDRPVAPLSIDDHSAAVYTVGQVAEMLGIQPAYLRRLDTEGLVQPARSDGGQRRYSRNEIGRVQRVSAMSAEGLTLSGIRRLLLLEAEVADLHRQLARERARNTSLPTGREPTGRQAPPEAGGP